MSLLKPEERKSIDGYFKVNEYRLLAHELMNWDHEPGIAEGKELAGKYGIDTKQLRYVISTLKDKDLFTSNEGSIPLYRQRLKGETQQEREGLPQTGRTTPMLQSPATTQTAPSMPQTPSNEDASFPVRVGVPMEETLPHEETPPSTSPQQPQTGEVDALRRRVDSLYTRMNGLGKDLGDIKGFMAQLSAGSGGNPGPVREKVNPSNPAPPTEPNTGDLPAELGEYAQEELLELLLNRQRLPREDDGPRLQTIEAPQTMVRRMIIEVTTFTQMLYEKALNDGAFEGTFSDFMNWGVAKYFEDRGWSLDWHKWERAGGRH